MSSAANGNVVVSSCRQNFAVGIAVLEMIISLTALAIYTYAYITFPLWRDVIPLPGSIVSDKLLLGLINSSGLICVLEFVMAILLFDGARRKIMFQIRIWLTSMLTYMVLTVVLVAGLAASGLRVPEMDAFICLTQFIRFLIVLPVYAFLEDENMKTMKKQAEASAASNCASNYSTVNNNFECEDPDFSVVVIGTDEDENDSTPIIPNGCNMN